MITIIPIEPLNDEHGMLIVEAFNKLFIDGGGKQDGWGKGYGWSNGGGYDDDDKCPKEWRIDESSMKPTGG